MPPLLLISSIAYCITKVESSSGTAKAPVKENSTPTLIGSPFFNVAAWASLAPGIQRCGAAIAAAAIDEP